VLTLEVELLTSVYRATLPDGSEAEWPPHPERIYCALVQAWGDGGRIASERQALEWLECLDPPIVQASATWEIWQRDAPTVYVPPNDMKGSALDVLPEKRIRHARVFRAVAPGSPLVKIQWAATPTQQVRESLVQLSARTACLGHSSSLARFNFRFDDARLSAELSWQPDSQGTKRLRAPYRGRLADLESWFSTEARPVPRWVVSYREPGGVARTLPQSVFAGPDSWFVFEDVGGFRPDPLALAHVTTRMRGALVSLAKQPVTEILLGHASNGGPSQRPHVAIAPLLNVGWPYSTGDLLGLAVVLPRDLGDEDRQAVISALASFASFSEGSDTASARLKLFGQETWHLERAPFPSRASLKPSRWCRAARCWASATPVLLDRFPEKDSPTEEAALIAAACRHIGLPEPARLEIHKHSALKGAQSAYPARGSRGGDWTFPADSKLKGRPRRHVVLEFEESVRGPILLGAGRYYGFGMCLPLEGAPL